MSPSAAPSASPLHQNLARLQGAAGNRAVQRLVSKTSSSRAPVQRDVTDKKPDPNKPFVPGAQTDEQLDAFLLQQQAARDQELVNMESAGSIVSGIAPTPATYKAPDPWAQPPKTRARSNAVTEAPGDHPTPLSLSSKYKDEDKKAGWRAYFDMKPDASPEERAARARGAETTGIRTDYHSAETREKNTLKPVDGRLMADGAAADVGAFEHHYPGGGASMAPTEYAMSPSGDIVANLQQGDMDTVTLPSGQKQTVTTHHSSMLAGGDAAHAGHIGVSGGKVNYLDDDSGHYRPSEAHTFDAFSRMADQGVLDPTSTTGKVKMVDKTVEKGKGHGVDLNVPFAHFAQSGGNEAGMRAKVSMVDEFKAKAKASGLAPKPEPSEGGGMVFEEGSSYAAYAAGGGVSSYNAGAYYDVPDGGAAASTPATPATPAPSTVPTPPAPPLSSYNAGYMPLGSEAAAPPTPTPAATPAADSGPSLYSQYVPFTGAAPQSGPSLYAPSLAPATVPAPTPPAPPTAYASSLATAPTAPSPEAAASSYSAYMPMLPPERRT